VQLSQQVLQLRLWAQQQGRPLMLPGSCQTLISKLSSSRHL